MNNLDTIYIHTSDWIVSYLDAHILLRAEEGEYKPWIKVGTSVVVRRVNAIHCGLPASLCVHIYPSGCVRVGKYIRFIGERNRAARKGHTLPTLQWYLKPLFPHSRFVVALFAIDRFSSLFPSFPRTRARKKSGEADLWKFYSEIKV